MEKACLFSLVGGLFGNPLAMYMGYPPKALRTCFGVVGIAIIDPSSYGVFFPEYMSGDLVLELIVIRVSGFFLLGFMFRQKPKVNSLLLYQLE